MFPVIAWLHEAPPRSRFFWKCLWIKVFLHSSILNFYSLTLAVQWSTFGFIFCFIALNSPFCFSYPSPPNCQRMPLFFLLCLFLPQKVCISMTAASNGKSFNSLPGRPWAHLECTYFRIFRLRVHWFSDGGFRQAWDPLLAPSSFPQFPSG